VKLKYPKRQIMGTVKLGDLF